MHVRGGKSTLLLALKYKSWWRPGENGAGNPMKWWSHQMLAMKRGRWMGTAHILVTLWMPNILLIIYMTHIHSQNQNKISCAFSAIWHRALRVGAKARFGTFGVESSSSRFVSSGSIIFCVGPMQQRPLLCQAVPRATRFSIFVYDILDVWCIFFWRFLLHKIFGLVVHFPGFLCWFGKRDGIPRT